MLPKFYTALTFCSLVSLIGLGGCLFTADMCGNELLEAVYSPDRVFKAVVFERNCGATTGFTTQISILLAEQTSLPNQAGNIFISNGNRGKAPVGPGGGPPVTVVWQGNRNLHITYDPRASTYLTETVYDRVNITYEQKEF